MDERYQKLQRQHDLDKLGDKFELANDGEKYLLERFLGDMNTLSKAWREATSVEEQKFVRQMKENFLARIEKMLRNNLSEESKKGLEKIRTLVESEIK